MNEYNNINNVQNNNLNYEPNGNNNNFNIPDNNNNNDNNINNNKTSKGALIAIITIAIVIACGIVIGLIGVRNVYNNTLKKINESVDNILDGNNNNNSNNQNNNVVKGIYSRDAFSGNSFEYNTGNLSATFIFNKDNTFEVNYSNGNSYQGTFELYNGLYVSTKADEIKNDTSIPYAQQLSTDINNVANKMMNNVDNMLNTYLLWFKTNDNTIQPFMVSYNPDTSTGTAVNILGQEQGIFNLK